MQQQQVLETIKAQLGAAMPFMAAASKALAAKLGASWLRVDFFVPPVGDTTSAITLNEVAYGSGIFHHDPSTKFKANKDDQFKLARAVLGGYAARTKLGKVKSQSFGAGLKKKKDDREIGSKATKFFEDMGYVFPGGKIGGEASYYELSRQVSLPTYQPLE